MIHLNVLKVKHKHVLILMKLMDVKNVLLRQPKIVPVIVYSMFQIWKVVIQKLQTNSITVQLVQVIIGTFKANVISAKKIVKNVKIEILVFLVRKAMNYST